MAQLDTMVTLVDVSTFEAELASIDTLMERGWQAEVWDTERTIAHLLVDQVEFANVVVLNKCDLARREDCNDSEDSTGLPSLVAVKAIIRALNPGAVIVEAIQGVVPSSTVLGTRLFSLAQAAEHPAWLTEARHGEHTPESVEYGISSFTFRSRSPFDPVKFQSALERVIRSSRLHDNRGGQGSGCSEDTLSALECVVRLKVSHD